MSGTKYKFHFPWRIHFATFISLLWLTVFFSSKNTTIELFLFLLMVSSFPILGIWLISVMTITSNGINLYRINNLVWSDVAEAKVTKFIGLPYIHIKRNKGMEWWLPLYFKGNLTVEDALIKKQPKQNPKHIAIYENNKNT